MIQLHDKHFVPFISAAEIDAVLARMAKQAEDDLKGETPVKMFNRLEIVFNDGHGHMEVLNDVLVCHRNPAALSRYYLKIGHHKEEQKSSGLWVSTAAGSSGGIYSAGGKVLSDQSRSFQYRPRELYRRKGSSYKLNGALLRSSQILSVTSLMREGVVFVDGSHVCLPFSFGTTVKIKKSSHPLKVVWI